MDWSLVEKELDKKRKISSLGGGEKKIVNQHSKNKLTARERLSLLFDKETFVEMNALSGMCQPLLNMEKNTHYGDGVVTGFGEINGKIVYAYSQDFTIRGGTLGELHAKKILAIQKKAFDIRAPFICIIDSGGARIEEGLNSLDGYAQIFFQHTKASGIIPQIAIVLGSCSGGASYVPALCDFVFMVKDISRMFLTGPKVANAIMGGNITEDELGGPDIHYKENGTCHFLYKSELECFSGVRKLLSFLSNDESSSIDTMRENKYNIKKCEMLTQIVPTNLRKAYDVKEVIECVVDKQSFFEIQAEHAENVIIGFAYLDHRSVGIIANQPIKLAGALDVKAANKMARFIRFCDCFNIPLITLVDVPAFLPGKEQEKDGIIKCGAKVLYAYAEATVPKITLIMRKAFGGAYIAMNSKGLGADIVYAWPISEMAVMGPENAIEILCKNISYFDSYNDYLKEYYEKIMSPYVAAQKGYVDEIIKPSETREKLLSALKVLTNSAMNSSTRKHGNIPL